MKRSIIKIDETLCNGCGLCAAACHEGAIGMVGGKARLLRDDYCDGLGDCLPVCPTNAISFEEREAAPYDEAAVKANMAREQSNHAAITPKLAAKQSEPLPCGCPGTHSKRIERSLDASSAVSVPVTPNAPVPQSRLSQWPVQIKLVPVNAPYFDNANLLVAADCTAFAYGDFHNRFIKNHIALIGCPKLDMTEYSEKLTEILAHNNIKSVKVVRMEVPCCGGIEHAVKTALMQSGKMIPWQVVTVTTDGQIIE